MSFNKVTSVLAMCSTLAVVAVACDDGAVASSNPGAGSSGSAVPGGSSDGGAATDGGVIGTGGVGASEMAATFSPAEVASLVLVTNLGEVQQGQLALQKATSPDVRAFAQRMVTEHSQAVQRLQLIQGVGGGASPSETTAAILARHDQLIAQDLQTQSGAAFDLAYMTAQIEAHAKLIALVDRALLPSLTAAATGVLGTATVPAGTPELQRELATLRPAVAQHLVESLELQRVLRGSLTGIATPPQ